MTEITKEKVQTGLVEFINWNRSGSCNDLAVYLMFYEGELLTEKEIQTIEKAVEWFLLAFCPGYYLEAVGLDNTDAKKYNLPSISYDEECDDSPNEMTDKLSIFITGCVYAMKEHDNAKDEKETK